MRSAYALKVLFLVALFSLGVGARGQDIASVPAAKAACGPQNVKFEVTRELDEQPLLQGSNAKAVVYIAQDFPTSRSLFHFTTRVGVDGRWVGANQDRSYFGFLIDPGVHHVCVSGQWPGPTAIALHALTAKAGETYYFAVRFIYLGSGAGVLLDLETVDEDEGQLLVQSSKHSTSRSK